MIRDSSRTPNPCWNYAGPKLEIISLFGKINTRRIMLKKITTHSIQRTTILPNFVTFTRKRCLLAFKKIVIANGQKYTSSYPYQIIIYLSASRRFVLRFVRKTFFLFWCEGKTRDSTPPSPPERLFSVLLDAMF